MATNWSVLLGRLVDTLAEGKTAPGAGLFPFVTEDSLVGFLEQSSRFLKPVFAGDTLYPTLEVDEVSLSDLGMWWKWRWMSG